MNTTPPIHLRPRGKLDEAGQRLALRAALHATHLLGLATGTHLSELRGMNDPLAQLRADLEQAQLQAALAQEAASILAERFAKVPERNRPYYSRAQRFRILEIRNLLAWNARDTARTFLVCANTILNWEHSADPVSKTVGADITPVPPVRRAADVVRATIQVMARFRIGGPDLTARILARAGWKVSSRAITRYRNARATTPPPNIEPDTNTKRRRNPVWARFVHHTWMMDVSVVKRFLGPEMFMAAVFDSFSRVPLTIHVFHYKPSAKDMATLLRRTAKAFAHPRYVITDLGGEFTGKVFRRAVARIGAVHRTASADSILATAQLERFWRTAKELARLYRFQLPANAQDLERRLALAIHFYICFRPHEGLEGATPREAFLGIEPAHRAAVEPPRGRPGEAAKGPPFKIAFLDHEHQRFPLLESAA